MPSLISRIVHRHVAVHRHAVAGICVLAWLPAAALGAQPTISVTKTASPAVVLAPGETVTFTFQVVNTGSETLTLTSLVDDIRGGLNGQGSCRTPQTIAPGNGYTCSLDALVGGSAGESETNTVTATVEDGGGTTASASDSATVPILGVDFGDAPDAYPTRLVDDGARHVLSSGLVLGAGVDPDDDGQPDAGAAGDDGDGNDDEDGVVLPNQLGRGTNAVVDIEASGAGVLNAWVDFNIDGDWDDPGERIFIDHALAAGLNVVSFAVPAGATLGPSFARFRLSTDTGLLPTGLASDGEVEDYAVVLSDSPGSSIRVTKTASPSVDEPGGVAVFTVRVDDTGGTDVTLTALIDDVHGDLDGRGTCAVPQTIVVGSSYKCSFTANVDGNAGFSETDTVSASGTDAGGRGLSADDSATVTVADVPPAITVTRTADPTSVDEPGGDVTFTVRVDNASVEDVTLTALVDDVHGDLDGLGTCSVPRTIATGGAFECAFTAAVGGNAGFIETGTVTATAGDDEGNTASADGSATVTITDVPPAISLTKTASPTSVFAPGGPVTFTVRVDNTSAVDAVTLDDLFDDVHGDLNGRGSCSLPQSVAVGGFFECAFDADVLGDAGMAETDTVTATAVDDDGSTASAGGSATVEIRMPPFLDEFQVNTYTSGPQDSPAIAADAAGNFVVVWRSLGPDGGMVIRESIQGQRYTSAGAPSGGQFQVNQAAHYGYGYGLHENPAVAMQSDGGFVVAWESFLTLPPSRSAASDVLARRFAADGSSASTFQLNTYFSGNQVRPDVAMQPGGELVAVWQSDGSAGGDTDSWSVQGKRFPAEGIPLDSQFQVNTVTAFGQQDPAVAVDAQGRFLVVWTTPDGDDDGIAGQGFHADGTFLGEEFQVNATTGLFQGRPAVAADASGFIVVWESDGPDGSGLGVRGRRVRVLDDLVAPEGEEFQVNTSTSGDQARPRITTGSGDHFVVVWESSLPVGSGSDIFVRHFFELGFMSDDFRINTFTTGAQTHPAVADLGGDFVVVTWTSEGSVGDDTDSTSVAGKLTIVPGIFADGFESGNTVAWSSTVP